MDVYKLIREGERRALKAYFSGEPLEQVCRRFGYSRVRIKAMAEVENPLETDPIVVHIIDPPPFGFLAENEKQSKVIKNRFSLLSIYVFPFS